MANYTARVELHYATDDDYNSLHAAMARRGFSRTVIGNDSVSYLLPTGLYDVTGTSATLEQAYSAAHEAAQETQKSHWIFVAQRDAARFFLAPAR